MTATIAPDVRVTLEDEVGTVEVFTVSQDEAREVLAALLARTPDHLIELVLADLQH